MSASPPDHALIDVLRDLDFLRSLPGIDVALVAAFTERARAGLRQPPSAHSE